MSESHDFRMCACLDCAKAHAAALRGEERTAIPMLFGSYSIERDDAANLYRLIRSDEFGPTQVATFPFVSEEDRKEKLHVALRTAKMLSETRKHIEGES